jgi:hypothetical protein
VAVYFNVLNKVTNNLYLDMDDNEENEDNEKDLVIENLRMINQAINEKLRLLNIGIDRAMDKVTFNTTYCSPLIK